MALLNDKVCKSPLDPNIFLADATTRRNHQYVAGFYEERLPKAVAVVEDALKRYAPIQFAIAFNGGKDCTVLLDLVLKTIRSHQTSNSRNKSIVPPVIIVYFRSRPQFPALETFIQEKVAELSRNQSIDDSPLEHLNTQSANQSTDDSHIEVLNVQSANQASSSTLKSTQVVLSVYEGDLKESLARFKKDHPLVEGIFMGTRCKDPRSKDLSSFSPTDPTWPSFVRILPILHFSYHDVWLYLKEFKVSYCPIYDEGYTSIGWEGNTFRNPKLKTTAADGTEAYKPAFLLDDSDEERSSRE